MGQKTAKVKQGLSKRPKKPYTDLSKIPLQNKGIFALLGK